MRPAEAGIIYDIGYQRYEGARLGRGYAFRTLFAHSMRQAWGLGRGGKALIIPFLLLFLICMPAVVQVLVGVVSGGEGKLLEYSTYFRYVQPLVLLFWLVAYAVLLVGHMLVVGLPNRTGAAR